MRDTGHAQPPPDRDFAEVAQALAHHAEDISVKLLGEPTLKSRREFRWGRRGSLSLRISGTKRGSWYNFERGEGGDLLDLIARERGVSLSEAIRIAERDYLGGNQMPPSSRRQPSRPSSAIQISDDVEARIQAAHRKWRETVPIVGTLGERYFTERRKLDVARFDLDHCLRYHVGIGAVVALMTDPVSAEPIGIHRTFLNAEGVKIDRRMLGRQGVVRLLPNSEVTTGLGITEGIEDGLAVMLSGWAPVWVATNAGAIARFPTLPGVEALTIFADADEPGIRAANACAVRWRSAGLALLSHTKKCIGAPNQRKLLCCNDFLTIRKRPDDDRL